jgi:hypothetical protein
MCLLKDEAHGSHDREVRDVASHSGSDLDRGIGSWAPLRWTLLVTQTETGLWTGSAPLLVPVTEPSASANAGGPYYDFGTVATALALFSLHTWNQRVFVFQSAGAASALTTTLQGFCRARAVAA